MTRTEMIDEAVRRSIKPQTMKRILRCAATGEEIRSQCTPGAVDKNDLMIQPTRRNHAHPIWWRDKDKPFDGYPRRLKAIRTEFNRIAAEHANA